VLKPEQRERFFDRERRDAEVWARLTARQRRMPCWRQRELQWRNAGKAGLLLLMLAPGEPLPEPLARALDLATKEPPRRGPGGTPEEVVRDLITNGLFAGMQKREER
jgi:hypothetical protein